MTYARRLVYVLSILLGLIGIAYYGGLNATLRDTRLEEYFGYLAVIYIYIALLPSPLYAVFPQLPGKALANRARRAIGISSFVFAFLHATIAFFGLLEGFAGLPFLDATYLIDLALSALALVILFLLAATSFDYFVRIMGPWWKRLHRFLYLAGFLIILHVFALGSHFESPDTLPAWILLVAVFALLVLEGLRFDLSFGIKKLGWTPRFSALGIVAVAAAALLYSFAAFHGVSLSAHAGHTH